MDVLGQANKLSFVNGMLTVCRWAIYLFRISSIESDASVYEPPFHVLVECWANVEPEGC